MDGVLGVSWTPFHGAAAAVTRLHAAGVPLRVLTNTTALARARFGGVLREAGFPFADEDILTASVLAGAWLRGSAGRPGLPPRRRPGARTSAASSWSGWTSAPEVVLVSGADESFCFETLQPRPGGARGGAELVAMHRNLSWMTRRGEKLDAGAYLLRPRGRHGARAVVLGKPAASAFRAGLDALGLPAGRVAMVGDDVENDVLAAQALGITGVLVRTGKFRERRRGPCLRRAGSRRRLRPRPAGAARRLIGPGRAPRPPCVPPMRARLPRGNTAPEEASGSRPSEARRPPRG